MAFAVADRILMLQNAIYEIIAPEGAATILFRDVEKASQLAEQLKLTASDCLELGVIGAIIPEPLAGAHVDPPIVMQALEQHLFHAIIELEHVPMKQLLARRYRKFRHYGRFLRKQHSLARASAAAVGQGYSILHQLKDRVPLAFITRMSTFVIHGGGRKKGLAS